MKNAAILLILMIILAGILQSCGDSKSPTEPPELEVDTLYFDPWLVDGMHLDLYVFKSETDIDTIPAWLKLISVDDTLKIFRVLPLGAPPDYLNSIYLKFNLNEQGLN